MNYKFRKINYSANNLDPLWQYGVEVTNKSFIALEKIEWWGWTSSEIQMIIDKSKTLSGEQEFDYQVEGSGFLMSIDKDEVYFYDMHNDQKEEDFKWTLSEFMDFMEKFKTFVEENS